MTTSTVFYGFGAFVGAIRGLRLVDWWPAAPASLSWDRDKLITTDLDKTPLAVANGQITHEQIEADDHITNLGLTRIGPRYPQGEMVGAVWIPKSVWEDIPEDRRPPRHQSCDAYDYELTSILYWNSITPGARYFGFRGRIVGPGNDGRTLVDVWHAGRGRIEGERPRQVEIDFSTEVDRENTEIDPHGGTQDGAIYIEDRTARALQLMSPKRPESTGFGFFPGR